MDTPATLYRREIERVIQDEVNPMVGRHLGKVEYVKFEDGVVYVRLLGTCKGCPLSELTLKEGIEMILKERINGVERVEAVE